MQGWWFAVSTYLWITLKAGWYFLLLVIMALVVAYLLKRLALQSWWHILRWSLLATLQFVVIFLAATRWLAAGWSLTLFIIPQSPRMQYHPDMNDLWWVAIKPPFETFIGYVIYYEMRDYIQLFIIVLALGAIFTLVPAILRQRSA